ncbi:unnamed protein product [marine sediment metagenome]|uniref:Uncharacterized protein n=1 Tax=marine sediment metagenome TaxID=412755 RepID=X1L8R3_9ZZZZ
MSNGQRSIDRCSVTLYHLKCSGCNEEVTFEGGTGYVGGTEINHYPPTLCKKCGCKLKGVLNEVS